MLMLNNAHHIFVQHIFNPLKIQGYPKSNQSISVNYYFSDLTRRSDQSVVENAQWAELLTGKKKTDKTYYFPHTIETNFATLT